jgi:hypothetical protein
LQTIRTSTALLVTASDSKKKLEPKHAFEGEREATAGWVVAGRPRGWGWGGGGGLGAGAGSRVDERQPSVMSRQPSGCRQPSHEGQ